MSKRFLPATFAALFVLVFAPTGVWLWQRWTMSIWQNGHGMFMPLIVGYLMYQHLKTDPSKAEESSPWGLLFLIPGLLLVVVDSSIRTQLLSALGLILCVIGLVLLFLGARRTKALTFPLLLLFFMLPIPTAFVDRLVLLLRLISADGCEHVVRLLGLPVLRDFTTIDLPNTLLEITEACSGFSTLYASVTMAFILAYLISSNLRRFILLVVAPVIALACNILRCTVLAFLTNYRGAEVLGTPLHPLTGIISFSLALLLLLSISWFQIRREHRSDSNVSTVPAARSSGAVTHAGPSRDSLLR